MKLDTLVVHNFINSNENLMKFYNFYLDNCLSISVPYHNLRHTLGMMYHIIRIYRDSLSGKIPEYADRMPEVDLYTLLTSALFHDFNHSAGRFSDAVNVANAKKGLERCLMEFLPSGEDRDNILLRCKKNIDATQYPYIISDEVLDTQQRILRECDLLGLLYDDFFTNSVMGLMSEMNGQNKSEFLVSYLKFIFESVSNFKFSYSIKTWNDNQDAFLNEINVISNIFQQKKSI